MVLRLAKLRLVHVTSAALLAFDLSRASGLHSGQLYTQEYIRDRPEGPARQRVLRRCSLAHLRLIIIDLIVLLSSLTQLWLLLMGIVQPMNVALRSQDIDDIRPVSIGQY